MCNAVEGVLQEKLYFLKRSHLENGNRSLGNLLCVEYVSAVNKNSSARVEICATLHEQPFQLCES